MIITGGKYKGRNIVAPNENITRPTLSKVRMGVFNTLFSIVGDFQGLSFLDVFGGSGVMGLEALSRGFDKVLVFEKNPKAAQIIKKNYLALGLTPNLQVGDSLKLLAKIQNNFDIIYVDPPYQSGIYNQIFELIKTDSIVIAEHSNNLIIPNFNLIKEKNYGGKKVSFFQKG